MRADDPGSIPLPVLRMPMESPTWTFTSHERHGQSSMSGGLHAGLQGMWLLHVCTCSDLERCPATKAHPAFLAVCAQACGTLNGPTHDLQHERKDNA